VKKAKAIDVASTGAALAPSPARVIETDLAESETRLRRLLDSRETLIAEICHYLVDGRGKRLRPTFMLLVFRACGGGDEDLDGAIDAGIALELIHSATLLHDDIIDDSELRRGKPSAYARYGFGPSLIAGDYLFCRAFELCARFDEQTIVTAARACIQLTEGEVMEGRYRHNTAATLEDYIAVITRKTASLFEAGGRVAAGIARAPRARIDAMGRLGLAMGLAFQMVDDLLDVLGPEEKIGKPVGSDLRAGVPSLPVVLGIARNPELKTILREAATDDGAAFDRALAILSEPPLVAEARAIAAGQVATARRILSTLPPSPYRDSLGVLIDEQIKREV
jgi:geranylgeranyl pyrophosphate synthase